MVENLVHFDGDEGAVPFYVKTTKDNTSVTLTVIQRKEKGESLWTLIFIQRLYLSLPLLRP